MNDFVNKYKNKMSGAKGKSQAKDDKKAVTKALHQTFKVAMQGQIAGITHNGVPYLMVRQDVFNDIIKNGGNLISTDEQKAFHKEYQILMHMMQGLNIEDPKESELFDEIDQFTFDFSENMNNQNGANKRKEILKEFKQTIESHDLLTSMYKNLNNQLFQENKAPEKVENNGKLT